AYDLPDETAYAETCAAVGMVFWNHRMSQLTGDGKYADVMERALYNGAISGVSLDGRRFFYENPLASRGAHHRQDWFDCACCPPNIARLIASVGGYFYSTDADGVWVHLYASGEARMAVGEAEITARQTTNYPWEGRVEITLHPDRPRVFALNLRIPGWCEAFTVSINGAPASNSTTRQGYARLAREWRAGDIVTLSLAMPAQWVRAKPAVRQMLGRVAIQRGPIVYCLESADNPIAPLDRIALPEGGGILQAEYHPDLLGGVTVLRGDALALDDGAWNGALYRAKTKADSYSPIEITAVPYYAWDNREPGEMRVWLRSR
ncbi:MAG TPA: beta-L-arabinofuranosidase domain-containing protein, partial [Anaerolineales bacterium]|nr:beta-L-arabinofuranosidase domain-containing protein [Anaerolineales bacterium]